MGVFCYYYFIISLFFIVHIICCQSANISNNITIFPIAYSQNTSIEKNQNVFPLSNLSSKEAAVIYNRSSSMPVESIDNSSQNNNTEDILGSLEEFKNTISNSSRSIINETASNTQLIQRLNENLEHRLEQIKKSINDSALFANLGLTLGLISIALSLIIPFLYDLLKRPQLIIEAGDISFVSSGYMNVFVHGKVINKPHKYLRWIERNPVLQTRVTMEFLDEKCNRLPSISRQPLYAKWSSAPEPLVPEGKENRLMFDRSKLAFLYDQNINSDYEGQSFDIVVKVLSSEECYAMTGDTYAGFSYQGLRNISFRIVESKFLVKTQAMSGNHKSKVTTFTITNTGRHQKDIRIVSVD